MEKYARKCSATGRGMNEGYVVLDGDYYFSEDKYLIEWLRSRDNTEGLSDDYLFTESFQLEEWYYTEWEEIDDDFWFDADGNLYHMFDGKEHQIKNSVSASAFLEWYIGDQDGHDAIIESAIKSLQNTGNYSVSVHDLFRNCQYIPQYICNDCPPPHQVNYEYEEYQPGEVDFLNDIIIKNI